VEDRASLNASALHPKDGVGTLTFMGALYHVLHVDSLGQHVLSSVDLVAASQSLLSARAFDLGGFAR
jgi:hypothetical protein